MTGTRPLRVIVFGSRTWEDREIIRARLEKLPRGSTIVHGACSRGADHIAATEAWALGLHVEAHPADWYPACLGGQLDRSAGPDRNARMVSLGADLAIGFRMPGKSRGTDDMERKARAAGIPVEMHRPVTEEE